MKKCIGFTSCLTLVYSNKFNNLFLTLQNIFDWRNCLIFRGFIGPEVCCETWVSKGFIR